MRRAPLEPIRDWRVVSATLNPRATGGWEADGRFGHEGVRLVLELRNARRRVLPVPAAVSVAVLDPALPSSQQRLARWDLTPDQTAATFTLTAYGPGYLLELPWPRTPPKHSALELYVRVITPDGQELRIEQPLTIDFAQSPEGWELHPHQPGPHQPSTRVPRDRTTSTPDSDTMRVTATQIWGPRSTQ